MRSMCYLFVALFELFFNHNNERFICFDQCWSCILFDGIMIAVSYVQSRLTVGNSDQFKSRDAAAQAEHCDFT